MYISRTVWARITKCYRHIHTDLPYICTWYDVTNYFRSEVTMKKTSKMPHQTASSEICRERFKRGSPNFVRLSGTSGFINPPDMTSPATSNRHLSKFVKRSKMPPPMTLGRIWVARRFACHTNWWASCYRSALALFYFKCLADKFGVICWIFVSIMARS